MTAHHSRFEVVHSGPRRFHARFVSGNGETVFTSESYTTRRAAHEAIAVLVLLVVPSRERVVEVDEREKFRRCPRCGEPTTLCVGEDPHTFQSTHQSDHEEAAAICARCDARVACRELAMALQAASPVGEQYGIQGTWGGVLYGATKKVGRPRKVKVQ